MINPMTTMLPFKAYSSVSYDKAKKQSWYHGPDSKLGMFTYTCSKCGYHVNEKDDKCPGCGREFL